jgi:Flp pilus assembly protein TadG
MHIAPADRRFRCRGDDGTALAEAAFFTPVFLYLLFGFAELGLFMRDYVSMSAALADGSRQGSILGTQLDTDYQIIQAVKRDLAAVPSAQVQLLIVFNAGTANPTNPATATPPAACLQAGAATPVSTTSTTSFCNAYTPATDWTATDSRLYACSVATPYSNRSAGWCPTSRKTAATASATPPNGPPDYLGVYLRVKHRYVTGLFGASKTVEQTMITRLEPQSLA